MRTIRFRPSPALVVAAMALAVAAGSVAVAQQGTPGTIEGCVGDRGVLRIVPPSECTATESAIAWNQQGPKGDKGDGLDLTQIGELQTGGADKPPKRLTPKEMLKLPKGKLVSPGGGGAARSVFRDGALPIPTLSLFDPPVEVAKLILPAGRWVIIAKGMMVGTTALSTVGCKLVAGLDSDAGADGPGTFTRTVVHRFKKAGRALLECRGSAGPTLSHVKITAMSFSSLINKPYP